MGFILFVVALGVLGFGLFNHMQAKRILAAPFKTTGDLAKNPSTPDSKGAISTEGKVVKPEQMLTAPCSNTECLYYEVKIERIFEKSETTQDGTKTTKGSETLDTIKNGALVGLDDGSGAISVDLSKGADFDNLKESFKKEIAGHSRLSHVTFGSFTYDMKPISEKDSWTIGFRATERYVPVGGSLFVLGKLEGNTIVKPGWRAMMASSKGRDGLLGSVTKRRKFSFIGGGVTAAAAILLMIFAPASSSKSSSSFGSGCERTFSDAQARCSDSISSSTGNRYEWTVTKRGHYEIVATAPEKKIQLTPEVTVLDADGEELARGTAENRVATASVDLTPGKYSIVVRDEYGDTVKGGFSFELEAKAQPAAEEAPVAEEAPAEAPAADVAAAPAAKPTHAKSIAAPVAAPKAKNVAVAPQAAPAKAAPAKVQPRKATGKNLQD